MAREKKQAVVETPAPAAAPVEEPVLLTRPVFVPSVRIDAETPYFGLVVEFLQEWERRASAAGDVEVARKVSEKIREFEVYEETTRCHSN